MSWKSRRAQAAEYEGRALPHPDEAVYDQGLVFDLGTVVSRRRVLTMIGAGAGVASVGLLARSGGAFASTTPDTSAGPPSTEIPEETAGPFPGDGSNGPDALAESGIVRRDITKSFGDATGVAGGVPTTVELTVYDLANGGVPFEGVAVYVWHCTREGGYSMYSQGVEDENFLRGVQITDADGTVAFTSIFPACYDGRWPHIHFEVYPDEASISDAANVIATSQVALTEDVCTGRVRRGGLRGVRVEPGQRQPGDRRRLRRRLGRDPTRHDHRRRRLRVHHRPVGRRRHQHGGGRRHDHRGRPRRRGSRRPAERPGPGVVEPTPR